MRIWPLVFVLACKDREQAPPPPPPSTPAVTARPSSPKPALPAPEPDAAPPAPITNEQAFAAEPVDTAWRATTEHEIKRRLPKASEIECHTTQCRVTIVGTTTEVSAAMDQMQSDKSLRGIAHDVLLTAPEKQPDGKLALRAFVRFER